MTVTAEQISKAEAKGLINVDGLAAACDTLHFPFYLGCVILAKESPDTPHKIVGGANIYGHDIGGIFTRTGNLEVTETNYKEFLSRLAKGERSNGVGPMQLTYKGYHIGPVSLQAKGLKAWLPADNILYGISLLSSSYKAQLAKGLSVKKAFWNVAKIYNAGSLSGNGGVGYADRAVAMMPTWLAAVGDSDTKPTPPPPPPPPPPPEEDVAITDAEFSRIKDLIKSEVTSPSVLAAIARAVWETDGIIPAGDDETDSSNTAWKPSTFLRKSYNALIKPLKK